MLRELAGGIAGNAGTHTRAVQSVDVAVAVARCSRQAQAASSVGGDEDGMRCSLRLDGLMFERAESQTTVTKGRPQPERRPALSTSLLRSARPALKHSQTSQQSARATSPK